MSVVSTALVLAGGLGTRLRSMVHDVPKPMAPVHDKPFLTYVLDYWIKQGITRFMLSVGYLHQHISDYFGDEYQGAAVEYIVEEHPLGTGGAFLLALEALRNREPILLLNGDTYFEVDLKQLCQFANAKRADWVFSVFYTEDHGRYMPMQVAEDGRLLSMRAPRHERKHLANGGVYWFNPDACQVLQQKCASGPLSLDDDVFPNLLVANARMYGLVCEKSFIDIGLPADYARFQQQTK